MSEEWAPAAPEIAQHFNDADGGRAEEGRRSHSTETVTIGQLESLENARSVPAPEQHLRPEGPGATDLDHSTQIDVEGGIKHVSGRLYGAADEMRRDFDRGRNFERDRAFDRNPGQGRGR